MADESLTAQRRQEGLEHHRAGRWDLAAACYGMAIAAEPADPDNHFLLALVEIARGRLHQAHDCIAAALTLQPANADFLFCLGDIERQRGHLPAAIGAFEAAIRLGPPEPERLMQLADLCLAGGQPCAAEAWAREAVRLVPDNPEFRHMLADAIRAQGRSDDALPEYRAAAAGDTAYSARHQNLLMTMNYCDAIAAPQVFRAHRDVGLLPNLGPGAASLQVRTSPAVIAATDEAPIRVGYVSADFGHHVVSFFFEPLVTSHRRDRVRVFCYFTGGREDAQCQRIRGGDVVWRNVSALGTDDLVALMRSDRLHVAVDLSGHTAGNRLEAFARRVAPRQVSWLGYPNTTGVPAMDHRLTDDVCDPVGASDALHTETLWRLPRCFLVYQPRNDMPAPAPSPSISRGYVTFGCFNRIEKLSTTALRAWARVLASVPGSRLLLKARGLDELALSQAVRARFASVAGDPARLDLEGATTTYADHLARYAAVDIALDSYPYCGTTTTCEALWMGVPVLTLAGNTHASRVGASLLAAADCQHLICDSVDQLVAQAARMASSPTALDRERRTLRARVGGSELTDATGFAAAIEAAYAGMLAAEARP